MGKPFGRALRMTRFDRGLDLRGVGDAVGVAPSTIHRAERGFDLRLSSFARLTLWMRLTPDELAEIVLAECEPPQEIGEGV
jgi:transcriptional regulator with XRE-family HTH domain